MLVVDALPRNVLDNSPDVTHVQISLQSVSEQLFHFYLFLKQILPCGLP